MLKFRITGSAKEVSCGVHQLARCFHLLKIGNQVPNRDSKHVRVYADVEVIHENQNINKDGE